MFCLVTRGQPSWNLLESSRSKMPGYQTQGRARGQRHSPQEAPHFSRPHGTQLPASCASPASSVPAQRDMHGAFMSGTVCLALAQGCTSASINSSPPVPAKRRQPPAHTRPEAAGGIQGLVGTKVPAHNGGGSAQASETACPSRSGQTLPSAQAEHHPDPGLLCNPEGL